MPLATHTSNFMAAKVTAVSTSVVSIIGAGLAIDWSFDLVAFFLAVVGLLAAVVWAWLIGRLDSRYVKCADCQRSHTVSVNAVEEIMDALKDHEEKDAKRIDEQNREISHLGRELSKLEGIVTEALKRI